MKQQDQNDVVANQVDANDVDALSEELMESVAVESGAEQLFDDKKKEELEEGVLSKAAQEGVEVAASDMSAIDLGELATNQQAEEGAGGAAAGGMSTTAKGVAAAVGIAGAVAVGVNGSDDGKGGNGSPEPGEDDFITTSQKFAPTVSVVGAQEGGVMTYVVQLDKTPTGTFDLSVAITGGTVDAGDVSISTNKLTFAKGQTVAQFTVDVADNDGFTGDQTVEVTLSGGNLKDPVVAVGTVGENDANPTDQEVFTLTEAFTAPETISIEPITKTVTFIGFNPHAHGEDGVDNEDGNNASDAFPDEDANAQGNSNNLTNENPFDGGIPLYDLDANYNPIPPGYGYSGEVVQKGLMSYITDLTGLDFYELGLINIANGDDTDADNGGTFDNFPEIDDVILNNGDGTQSITIVYSDGTENTAEVQMGDYYFTLLTNLLFDSENNLRLYEQEVTFYPQVPVTVDGVTFYQNLYSYSTGGGVEVPIVLTTSINNGGTEEAGLTSDADNLIVAGRLDLLHGAYIDAGAGNNTLEIDAKGFYAQPKELLNIQTISIENLPNVYTDGPDTGIGDNSDDSTYPDLDTSYTNRYTNSIIDLSRAGDLESLVVSESNFQGLDSDGQDFVADAGDLTVAGIRGGATLTLDGAFSNNDYTFHFRETSSEGVNVVLHNVNFDDGDLILAHNSPTLNLASTGAGNVIEGSDLSGDGANSSNLTNLNITGNAKLFIEDSIADAFAEGTPATIDASGNTGGVDLKMNGFDDEVTFIGTAAADDHFEAHLDDGRSVTIVGGAGDGEYDVSTDGDVVITAGDGDNEISAESYDDDSTGDELEGTVTVTVGDGQNDISVYSTDAFAITAGDGDNRIEAYGGDDDEVSIFDRAVTEDDLSTIVIGDGQNEVSAYSTLLSVTAGNGGNEIEVAALELELTSGTGNDVIVAGSDAGAGGSAVVRVSGGDNEITVVEFDNVDVVTGGGDDALTIIGGNIDFGIDSGDEGDSGEVEGGNENGNETLIMVDLGLGTNTLTFGSNDEDLGGLTAVDGSTITGSNLTLVVNRDTDLSRAEISGVTAVQMRGDVELGDGDAAVLTLTVSQFQAMGGSATFSTIGQSFGAHSVINLIVDQDVSLDDLNVDDLPRSIDFSFEVMDGVSLSMTAQQLHERVTNMGVTAYVDGNGDFAEGSVYITGGAPNFDENDAMEGGSIHPLGQNSLNIYVSETVNGYERPADVVYFTRININTDTDLDGGVLNPFTTDNTFLRITGNSGLTFMPVAAGLDEWGQPIANAGDSIEIGVDADYFLIDYSTVGGDVEGLVIDHFEKALFETVDGEWIGGIYGNGIDARLDVKLDGDVGADEQGLISAGVQTFVVVDMYDGDHAFWTCETTQDLEVLGLQGEYEHTITFGNVERGVDFLMEVIYVKDQGYVVGSIVGDFARPGASAVVDVVGLMMLPEGETQMVAGIEMQNAVSVTVNVTGGNTEIEMFESSNGMESTESVTVTADADLTFPELSSDLESFNAEGVAGTLVTSVDPGNSDAGLDFVGAATATMLTIGDAGVDAIDSIGGAGPVALIIDEDATADLTEAMLSNVTMVTLSDDAMLSITMEQADQIGAANFAVAEGDSAELMLVGLSDQVFALANYDVEGDLDVSLTLANDPIVTLNPLTDLTGIDGLVIPEGTTLYLTMAQFQQLDDEGTLEGLGSVVITDTMQADVGEQGADLDLSNIDLTGTVADEGYDSTVTIMLAESVDLSDAVLMGGSPYVDAFIYGDDTTLTLGDIQNADGVDITGGANSTLVFTDTQTNIFESIDASGFAISFLYYTNTITNGGNRNIDDIFSGLAGDIEKFSYFGEGYVLPIDQVANIQATVTVTDSLVFNPSSPDTELNSLTFNMNGGTELDGNLRVSTADKFDDANGNGVQDAGEADLVRAYLRELIINSNGPADTENLLSGVAANVITGDITPVPGFFGGTNQTNNLLNVTINAAQDFILEGDLVFSSNVGGDAFASNDIEDATATLTINGTENVTLGGIDSSDGDVDAVVVTNAGTGMAFITLDENDIDSTDMLSFLGGNIHLTVEGEFDLSDDVLTGVSSITLDDGADVTLAFSQVQSIGVANIFGTASVGDQASTNSQSEDLVITGYDGSAFDFSAIDVEIDDVDIVLASGNIVFDPSVNLTGVTSITVQEGGSVSLTAAQFQQLASNGTIVGVDVDGNPSSDYTVNITSLMQSDINYDLDGDGYMDADDGFSVEDVTANDINISLGEAQVNLADYEDGVIVAGSVANIDGVNTTADFILTDGQTLGIATYDQANGLNIDGTGTTTAIFMFADLSGAGFGSQIDASGYDISVLKALALAFAAYPDANVEYVIDDLASSVELRLFANPEELGFLNPTFRLVTIEEDVVTPTDLAFNDWDPEDEVLTLTINFEGGAGIDGDLRIPTRDDKAVDATTQQRFFQMLTLNSLGDDTNFISGDIEALDAFPGTVENNLLSITINTEQDFVIGAYDPVTGGYLGTGGNIFFTSLEDNAIAYLNITGTGNVVMHGIDVSDDNNGDIGTPDIVTIVISNTSTGSLSITGGGHAVEADNAENLIFEGTGDILLGQNEQIIGETASPGVISDTVSLIDASGLSGDFTVGRVTEVDSEAFTFLAGTGVTNMSFQADELDSTGVDMTAGNTDDTAGWTIDFTGVAAGSELHLSGDLATNATPGSKFSVLADANTTIYIDSDYDLSGLAASLPTGVTIVLADEVTLTLTADQADGLTIVAGADTDNDGDFGVVNIVNLQNDTDPDDPSDAIDLSNISQQVAGTITLDPADGDADVTLDKATDLGFFSVTLYDEGMDGNVSTAGQTIRFQNVDQAERAILIAQDGADSDMTSSSTNVVWLFTNSLGGVPVNTDDYSSALGRLFLLADFIDNNGGDVEDTFTTLPNTILRIPAEDLNQLNILLNSTAINRIVEIEHFTTVGNLIFDDSGIDPEEHIQSVTLRLGGETVVGNIVIDDVFGANVDPASVSFNGVTIESYRAVETGDALANENFVNDNDGINELGEFAQPDNINTVGNISVGGGAAEIDLLSVTLDTGAVTVIGGTASGAGADLTVGNIVFDAEVANSVANLILAGANKITAGVIDWSDTEIIALNTDTSGLAALSLFDPELNAGTDGEYWTITDDGASSGQGTVLFDAVYGDELSVIDASGADENITLTISNIDGNDDDFDNNGIFDADGDDDIAMTADDEHIAFFYDASTGINSIRLDAVGGNTPELEAGSTWAFDFTGADTASTLTITGNVIFNPTVDPLDPTVLSLTNVNLVIEGDVDLTGITLDLTGTTLTVPAGQILHLTLEQIAALPMGTTVTGEGTVIVEGVVDTDAPVAIDLAAIQTVGVDLSQITNDGSSPQLNLVGVTLNIGGALDDAGDPAGFNFIGTAFNDFISGSNEDDTLTAGLGDDELLGQLGNDTFNVTAGTDTIFDLSGEDPLGVDPEQDVLVVSAGAEASAFLYPGVDSFIATAATVNNGTATITTDAGAAGLIDVSLAGGSNGFTLLGNGNADTLIGSDQDDIINGDDGPQEGGDVLTGNGGDDHFVFNVVISDPATFDSIITTPGEDEELHTVAGGTDGAGTVTIAYELNNVNTSIDVDLTDGDDVNLTAQEIAAALNGINGISASSTGADVTVVADQVGGTSNFIEINPVVTGVVGLTFAEGAAGDAADVGQSTTVTVTGTASANETYTLTVSLRNGTDIVANQFTAVGGETPALVAAAIAANLNAVDDAGDNVLDNVTSDVNGNIFITITDPDLTGGFAVSLATEAAFSGTGASESPVELMTDLGTAGLVAVDPDFITDFVSGEDLISVGDLDSGDYDEAAAASTSFADAIADAEQIFVDEGADIVLTWLENQDNPLTADVETDVTIGFLVFDVTDDDVADGVIALIGIDNTMMAAGDIEPFITP